MFQGSILAFFSFLCLTKCVSGMSVNFPVEESTLGCFNSSCFLQTSACLCQILRKKHFSSSCFHKLFQNYFYQEINIEARVTKLEFLWKCFCKINTYFWYFCVFDVTRTQGRTESHILGGVLSQEKPIFYLEISNSSSWGCLVGTAVGFYALATLLRTMFNCL